MTTSNTKGRPRRHFAECRTSGGRRKPTKSNPTLPQRIQKCSSAPSVKSTALPSHAPRLSCQLTTQPCFRRRAAPMQGGGDTSALTVLDKIPQKPVIISLYLSSTIEEVSKAIRQTTSGKSRGLDGIPAEIFQVSWSRDPRSTPLTPHQHLARMLFPVRLEVLL